MPVRLSGKDIVKALGKGGWELERVTGSHHVMRHAVRAAYDPAQAPRFRAGHPGAADDHPELPAVGTFRAGPAAEHRFGGTFTKRAAAHPAESEPERFTNPQFAAKPKRPAKPERVVNVAIP